MLQKKIAIDQIKSQLENETREARNSYNEEILDLDRKFHSELHEINRSYAEEIDDLELETSKNNFDSNRIKIIKNALKDKKKHRKSLLKRQINHEKAIAKLKCNHRVQEAKCQYSLEKNKLENKFQEQVIDANERNKKVESGSRKETSPKSIRYVNIIFIILTLVLGVFLVTISDDRVKESEVELEISDVKAKIKIEYISENQRIETQKIPNKQLVKSNIGEYYKINLKLADSKKKVLFPTGEYFFDEQQKELINSINEFRKEIYGVIEQNYETKLFVKGTADALGRDNFEGSIEAPYNKDRGFTDLKYFPNDPQNRMYTNQFESYHIEKKFDNKDLPNLRARFLQYIFSESDPDLPVPIILEGNVKDVIDDQERNAYLIMFVNWEKKIEKRNYNNQFLIGLAMLIIALLVLIIVNLKSRFGM